MEAVARGGPGVAPQSCKTGGKTVAELSNSAMVFRGASSYHTSVCCKSRPCESGAVSAQSHTCASVRLGRDGPRGTRAVAASSHETFSCAARPSLLHQAGKNAPLARAQSGGHAGRAKRTWKSVLRVARIRRRTDFQVRSPATTRRRTRSDALPSKTEKP